MAGTAISDVLTQLDNAIESYVFDGYSALSSAVSTEVTMALTAYVAFVGWSTTQSWAPLTTGNAVKHVMKMSIVVLLSLHWDFFSLMLYNVVTNGPDEIATILVGSSGDSVSGSNEALQDVFNKGIEKGNEVWKKGGPLSTGYYLAAICIYIFDYLSAGFALLEISVAKCGAGLTVVLAPIFSSFLLWEGGKGVFASWLKVVFGFALVPIILTSVMMLMEPILDSGLNAINADSMTNGMGCLATFILGSFACVGLLFRSAMMAANIAGGLTVTTMDAMPAMRLGGGMMLLAGRAGAAVGSVSHKAGRWAVNRYRGKTA